MMKRLALSVAAAALMLTGLTACGGDDETYRPVAYGENGHCYYVEDPHEIDALYSQGNCPRSWTPMIMPVYWHSMYYPYYSSPAYYNVYVPATTRAVYVQHETVYKTQHASEIKTASAKARYKNSSGKTVTGNKIGTAKFGGGSRTSGGSGSRTKTCGMSAGVNGGAFINATTGGGSRSGGSTGGSRTSTRSGTGTRTTTRTGGC